MPVVADSYCARADIQSNGAAAATRPAPRVDDENRRYRGRDERQVTETTHAPSSARGTSTSLARRYSPRLFACGSLRVDDATPSPRRPCTMKLRLQRFGSAWRSTGKPAASGTSRRKRSTVSSRSSHAYAGPLRAQTPTLAFPPLSPERAPKTRPSGTRSTGPDGDGGSSTGATLASPPRATTGGMPTVSPPITTRCSTSSDGTSAGQ